MNFEIYDSFALVLNITALIPCIGLITLYLIDFKKLKLPNYFKLELMFTLLTVIVLNFIKDYYDDDNNQIISPNGDKKKNDLDHEKCDCDNYKIIALIRSYLEIVVLLLLAAFNYLCYFLLGNKDNKKLSLIIFLSSICWIIPIYIFILNFTVKDVKSENPLDCSGNNYISISGVCIFTPKIKQIIHLGFMPFIFIIDVIFFILTIFELNKRKKNDEDNVDIYNKNIKRISLNFIGHFIYFISIYMNNICLFKNFLRQIRYRFYNINYQIGLSILCIVLCLEGKTREYYNKLIESCLKLEKDVDENAEEEEEYEEDENDDIIIYKEESRTESQDGKMM